MQLVSCISNVCRGEACKEIALEITLIWYLYTCIYFHIVCIFLVQLHVLIQQWNHIACCDIPMYTKWQSMCFIFLEHNCYLLS